RIHKAPGTALTVSRAVLRTRRQHETVPGEAPCHESGNHHQPTRHKRYIRSYIRSHEVFVRHDSHPRWPPRPVPRNTSTAREKTDRSHVDHTSITSVTSVNVIHPAAAQRPTVS